MVVFICNQVIAEYIPEWSNIISPVTTIALYYCYFYKRAGKLLTVAAITLIHSVLILTYLMSNYVFSYLPIIFAFLFYPVVLTILYLILKKWRYQIHQFLTNENRRIADWLVVYLYACALIVNIMRVPEIKLPAEIFGILIMEMQFLFIVAVYIASVQLQKKLLKKQEQRNFKLYLHDLEDSEDRLRRFKHDYLNLLATMRTVAVNNHDQKLVQELAQYTEKQINDENSWHFKNLNHLHNDALKSLVVNKLAQANELGIKYSFECEKEIKVLPKNVKLFDLVRIIGIAFDNAIEESEQLYNERAEIKVMFYQEKAGELEFRIVNKCRQKINAREIHQKDYTTKEKHQGLGLANVQAINDQYDNMFIEYSEKDNWFNFTMVID